ncbi:hypothetical protein, partial [Vibrio cholerae]|uniref:hypothetical protein n=1 Tax=Vibrio cholerae TaxID=666 RepID=UPI001C3D5CEB
MAHGSFFRDHHLAVAQERAVGREAILVIALIGAGVGHVRAFARQFFLALGTAVALDQHHFIAMLFTHDAIRGQQALAVIGVQQVPVAARAAQVRTHQFHFA